MGGRRGGGRQGSHQAAWAHGILSKDARSEFPLLPSSYRSSVSPRGMGRPRRSGHRVAGPTLVAIVLLPHSLLSVPYSYTSDVEHCLYQYLHREAMGKRLGEVSCDTQPPTPATHQLILDVGNTFLRLCSIVCTYNFCASRRTFACVEHPSFSPPRSPPGPHHGPTVGPRTNHATTRSRTRQRWRLYTFVLRLFLYVSPVRQ